MEEQTPEVSPPEGQVIENARFHVERPKPPPWAVFTEQEMIPLKGFWFKLVGYTSAGEVVFKCVGQTKNKTGKKK